MFLSMGLSWPLLNLLVTHTYQDHFYFEELYMGSKPFAKLLNEGVLHVYGNKAVYKRFRSWTLTNGRLKSVVEAHVSSLLKGSWLRILRHPDYSRPFGNGAVLNLPGVRPGKDNAVRA
jgi:hypothetical protein